MTQKIAWFHCFSGIAGDMALGSLVDAGADLEEIKKICAALDLSGYEITTSSTMRNGIAATYLQIVQDEKAQDENPQIHRTAADIFSLINNAALPERVKERSLKTFEVLAEVEGKLHAKPPEQVHFHEVGALDSIIDIVGTCAALECLEIDAIYSSPVAHGIGTIECEHGTMPNPPPAVVELLQGAPVYGIDLKYELTTPTGAALLKALVEEFVPLPDMKITSSGFGAGSREFPQLPNLTQVIIGEKSAANSDAQKSSNRGQPVMILEANLDDITGEVLADTIANLLSAGALDAWLTPILMKKGRPAHTISVLVDFAELSKMTDLLIELTGTLGVRSYMLERWPQPRGFEVVEVEGHFVRIKYSSNDSSDPNGDTNSNLKSAKPEYDDLAEVAKATGKPLREIQELAMQAFKEKKI